MFACYLLRSLNPRFRTKYYIGCTTDPQRRLRQHNGGLGQGAQHTKHKRPWEMVLCLFGFATRNQALQFEWAWQNPKLSLIVKDAAKKISSLKGVPGQIRLACTMVTLPAWNSENLTIQFMLSTLLQHRYGCPPLPPQMRVLVASVLSLPRGNEDSDDDEDSISTCADTGTQDDPGVVEDNSLKMSSLQGHSQDANDDDDSITTCADTVSQNELRVGESSMKTSPLQLQPQDGHDDKDSIGTCADTFPQDDRWIDEDSSMKMSPLRWHSLDANDDKDSTISTCEDTFPQDDRWIDEAKMSPLQLHSLDADADKGRTRTCGDTFPQDDPWLDEDSSMKMSPLQRQPVIIEITSSPEDDLSHGDRKCAPGAEMRDGRARKESMPERTEKGGELHQEYLTNVWPVRKQASFYRKGRKVLEERSKNVKVYKDVDTIKKYSGVEWNLFKSLDSKVTSDAVPEDDDDDELQEISAVEFQQKVH